MEGQTVEKKQSEEGLQYRYNLRRRKTSPREAKMGIKLTEERVELIPSHEFDSSGKKMFEDANDLCEDFLHSEGESDEAMLLPMEIKDAAAPVAVKESQCTIFLQILLPFLLAGIGMVAAGLVLDSVQHWEVFLMVTEVFIMVPALLGLKGNLEMTLASRLSTHSNLGHMDTRKSCISLIVGNLSLIQCQAIVVGFLSSTVAVTIGWISQGSFNVNHGILLCAAAVTTASLASFILGLVMIGVIVVSRRLKINPDNVATPIAASLGDLITISLLAWISSFLYTYKETWFGLAIPLVFLLTIPLWVYLASQNSSTKEVLRTGWLPVVVAMLISSIGGLILDKTVLIFEGIAVYQPLINGVGGNLVAVQASRLSTALHTSSALGTLPKTDERVCISPISAYLTSENHSRTARILLFLVIPGQLIFIYLISYLKAGHVLLSPEFIGFYMMAALLQVFILLYLAKVMINYMWKNGIDPDNSAIPYLTALGDFLGTGLLAVAFHIISFIRLRNTHGGN